MAIAISYQVLSTYTGWSGSSSVAFTGLPTGVPVIIAVVWNYGDVNTPTLGSFSLATDALSPTEVTGTISPNGTGKGAIYLYFSSITTANQNLTFTNSGSYVEGSGFAYTVTGHNTSDVFGRESIDTAATTLDFTFDTTGDAVIIQFWGTSSQALSFGEGTWSHNSQNPIAYWSSDLTAGVKSWTITGGVPENAAIVEIKATGGAGGGGAPLLGQISL